MVFKQKPVDNGKLLTFGGELTFNQKNQLLSLLTFSLENGDNLVVNIDRVTMIDISCLKLLCAANRTFEDSGKRLLIQNHHKLR